MALLDRNTEIVRDWAIKYIENHPDDPMNPERGFTVFQNGKSQLQRWYIIPRNDVENIYLHRFLLSDENRAPHDHRGDNMSWLLDGEYKEHLFTSNGLPLSIEYRVSGNRVKRLAEQLHQVELIDEKPVISLFFIGPIRRDWGFRCPEKWVPWQEFVSIIPGGNDLGKGSYRVS